MIRVKRYKLEKKGCEFLKGKVGSSADWGYVSVYVKRPLRGMFNEKCAYCERHAHTIEHFIPKKKDKEENNIPLKYTWDWENLLWACAICQGKKLDKDEKYFIHPCNDEPSDYLTYNLVTGKLVSKDNKGQTTIDELQLNSPSLVGARRRRIRRVLSLIRCYLDAENYVLLHVLCDELDKDEEYLGFLRDILFNPKLHQREHEMIKEFLQKEVSNKHVFWELIRQWCFDTNVQKLPKNGYTHL